MKAMYRSGTEIDMPRQDLSEKQKPTDKLFRQLLIAPALALFIAAFAGMATLVYAPEVQAQSEEEAAEGEDEEGEEKKSVGKHVFGGLPVTSFTFRSTLFTRRHTSSARGSAVSGVTRAVTPHAAAVRHHHGIGGSRIRIGGSVVGCRIRRRTGGFRCRSPLAASSNEKGQASH